MFIFPPAYNNKNFVLPKSSCIGWEIGNLDTILIFRILSMCFGKFFVTNLAKPKICYVLVLMLSFIRCFHLQYLTVSVPKMSYKNLNFGIFHNLMLFKNLSVCLAQISVTKFPN